MKKFLALTMALAMSLSLVACGGGDKPAESTPAASTPAASTPAASTPAAPAEKDYSTMTIDELKAEITTLEAGKLTVATSPDFAPYEFYAIDDSGNAALAGFEMSLAQHIADFIGLELEVVTMDFDGTLNELGAKAVDLGMAGYSPKPEREALMDFSDIFYTGGQSFVCLEANKDLFPDLASANKAEYSIGAQTGSIQLDLANENTPDADIVSLPKVTDIVAELVTGKLDGAFVETVVAQSYKTNYPELCVVLPVPYEQEGSVVGVYKGNEALLAAVNLAIADALESGAMDDYVATANELASGNIHEGLLEG